MHTEIVVAAITRRLLSCANGAHLIDTLKDSIDGASAVGFSGTRAELLDALHAFLSELSATAVDGESRMTATAAILAVQAEIGG